MAIVQFGSIVKNRREALEITQEDLAEGICSVATLSRIENGERIPTQAHLAVLLQRLGYSDTILNIFQCEQDLHVHDLKYQIRQAYMEKELRLVRKLLVEYEEALQQADGVKRLDRQFILLYRVLVYPEEYIGEKRLTALEEALRLTHPNYSGKKLPALLSYEEIIIVNSIALYYKRTGNRRRGIEILYALRNYYEEHIVNLEEALRTETMVLYNLSSMLGLEGRYEECIEVCEQGIRLARTTGRCREFGKTFYNYAWALVKRGQFEDREKAQELLRHAIHVAQAMGQDKLAAHCIKFAREHFPEDSSLI